DNVPERPTELQTQCEGDHPIAGSAPCVVDEQTKHRTQCEDLQDLRVPLKQTKSRSRVAHEIELQHTRDNLDMVATGVGADSLEHEPFRELVKNEYQRERRSA